MACYEVRIQLSEFIPNKLIPYIYSKCNTYNKSDVVNLRIYYALIASVIDSHEIESVALRGEPNRKRLYCREPATVCSFDSPSPVSLHVISMQHP